MSLNNELNVNDLPAPDELLSVSQLPAPSTLKPEEEKILKTPGMPEAFARAIASGASFNFSDELTGALESLLTKKSYEQSVGEARANNAAAAEAHPITSFAGEVAGGIIPAMAAAPLAAASGLTKLAKGASLIGKVGAGVLEGAGAGALYGAGKAESGETTDEAKSGALVGGAVGGAIPVVGRLLGAAGKAMKSENSPEFLHDVHDAFTLGLKKIGLISTGSVKNIKAEVVNLSEEFPRTLQAYENSVGSVKGHLLDNTAKTIQVDDIAPRLSELLEMTGVNTKGIEENLNKLIPSLDTAVPLKDASKIVSDLNSFMQNPNIEGDVKNKLYSIVKELRSRYTKELTETEADTIIKNAPPEVKSAYDSLMRNSKSKIPVDGIEQTTLLPLQEINKAYTNINDANRVLKDIIVDNSALGESTSKGRMMDLVHNYAKDTDASSKVKEKFKDAMGHLAEANPELSKTATANIQDVSAKHHLSKTARFKNKFENAPSGKGLVTGVLSDIGGLLGVGPANMAGQTYTKLASISKSPEQLISKLQSKIRDPNSILAKKLAEVAAEPSENKRRAAMNTLMQIPAFRQLMKDEDNQ